MVKDDPRLKAVADPEDLALPEEEPQKKKAKRSAASSAASASAAAAAASESDTVLAPVAQNVDENLEFDRQMREKVRLPCGRGPHAQRRCPVAAPHDAGAPFSFGLLTGYGAAARLCGLKHRRRRIDCAYQRGRGENIGGANGRRPRGEQTEQGSPRLLYDVAPSARRAGTVLLMPFLLSQEAARLEEELRNARKASKVCSTRAPRL